MGGSYSINVERPASAYAPGHLTGFFQICDEPEDPLLKGSRGSGMSITQGVHTSVKVSPADQNRYDIFFVNEPLMVEPLLDKVRGEDIELELLAGDSGFEAHRVFEALEARRMESLIA